jgi:hypothetical protein
MDQFLTGAISVSESSAREWPIRKAQRRSNEPCRSCSDQLGTQKAKVDKSTQQETLVHGRIHTFIYTCTSNVRLAAPDKVEESGLVSESVAFAWGSLCQPPPHNLLTCGSYSLFVSTDTPFLLSSLYFLARRDLRCHYDQLQARL